jgi:hypothetical protein
MGFPLLSPDSAIMIDAEGGCRGGIVVGFEVHDLQILKMFGGFFEHL